MENTTLPTKEAPPCRGISRQDVVLIVTFLLALTGWTAAFFFHWSLTEHRDMSARWEEAARGWKEQALDANAASLVARSGGDPKKVLLPKGTRLESSDGGKTFRVIEIGK